MKTISNNLWQDLNKTSRFIPVPFHLELVDSKELLICQEVIRIIPGKRLVAFATWGNQPVVAKLFYGAHAKQNHHREVTGIKTLVQSKVPTPEILYTGTSLNKKTRVLILKKIEKAYTFWDLWQPPQARSIHQWLRALVRELATQHVLGILQKDLHLKNFLISKKKIYTLDGGDVHHSPQLLSKKISLPNLALLVAQLGTEATHYQDVLLHHYAELRGWRLKKSDLQVFAKMVRQCQRFRRNQFQKKVFRTCSAFAKSKSLAKVILVDREHESAAFKNFFAEPNQIFSTDSEPLKIGRSATVVKAFIGEKYVAIKRYNIKNIWHGLRRCLRSTRAAKSWRLAQYLLLMGIPTAKPIAFIEKRFLGLRLTSYFVMEHINEIHLGAYFAQPNLTDTQKKLMVTRVMSLFEKLSQLQLTHGDMKMTNILVKDDYPLLIDLDGMKEHRFAYSFKRAAQKEFDRFLANWQDQPSLQQLFRNQARKWDAST